MLSTIAKILFPLSIFAYLMATSFAEKFMFSICPPPYAAYVLFALFLANFIYLLTFPIKPIAMRIIGALVSPLALIVGAVVFGRYGIMDGNLLATLCGLVSLLLTTMCYRDFYKKTPKAAF